jgi:cyclic pyranopterin phosphate synthase
MRNLKETARMIDACGREIDYLRISITDRCNLRCVYCMPEEGAQAMCGEALLSFEEIERIVRALTKLGIRALRLTGGEPMARRGCLALAARLHGIAGVETIAMTTNALLLEGRAAEAKRAGIDALNISLDTLDAAAYQRMTRGGDVKTVLRVIDEALAAGMRVKINAVPVKGWNDSGIEALAALARDRPLDVRFIELMPVGCGAALEGIPSEEVARRICTAYGPMQEERGRRGHGPARYARPEGFAGAIGWISPMSHAFCGTCNRIRLTADGRIKLCLNHQAGIDVRALLRGGVSDAALTRTLRAAIAQKPERHGFGEAIGDRESRRMNAIGG